MNALLPEVFMSFNIDLLFLKLFPLLPNGTRIRVDGGFLRAMKFVEILVRESDEDTEDRSEHIGQFRELHLDLL